MPWRDGRASSCTVAHSRARGESHPTACRAASTPCRYGSVFSCNRPYSCPVMQRINSPYEINQMSDAHRDEIQPHPLGFFVWRCLSRLSPKWGMDTLELFQQDSDTHRRVRLSGPCCLARTRAQSEFSASLSLALIVNCRRTDKGVENVVVRKSHSVVHDASADAQSVSYP